MNGHNRNWKSGHARTVFFTHEEIQEGGGYLERCWVNPRLTCNTRDFLTHLNRNAPAVIRSVKQMRRIIPIPPNMSCMWRDNTIWIRKHPVPMAEYHKYYPHATSSEQRYRWQSHLIYEGISTTNFDWRCMKERFHTSFFFDAATNVAPFSRCMKGRFHASFSCIPPQPTEANERSAEICSEEFFFLFGSHRGVLHYPESKDSGVEKREKKEVIRSVRRGERHQVC